MPYGPRSGQCPFLLAPNLGQVRAIGARPQAWTKSYDLSLSPKLGLSTNLSLPSSLIVGLSLSLELLLDGSDRSGDHGVQWLLDGDINHIRLVGTWHL